MPNFMKCLRYIQEDAYISLVEFSSNAVCISCNIDSSWAKKENPGKKPDWESVKSLFLKK